MELDRLTIKSKAALQEAHQQASARHHQQIEPEHVLYALLTDPEGVVFPLLHQLGVVPKQLRDTVDERLAQHVAEDGTVALPARTHVAAASA